MLTFPDRVEKEKDYRILVSKATPNKMIPSYALGANSIAFLWLEIRLQPTPEVCESQPREVPGSCFVEAHESTVRRKEGLQNSGISKTRDYCRGNILMDRLKKLQVMIHNHSHPIRQRKNLY